MIDPISAFAMAQAAISGVKKCVELYKEAREVGADVVEITAEVTGHIGSFMEHSETMAKAVEESKKSPPARGESLNKRAFDNIMKLRQLQEAEKELREFLIYQTPGWGAIWTEFEAERARLRKEQESAEREAKKLHKRLLGNVEHLLKNIKSEFLLASAFCALS
jgi:phage-related tail protein